MYVNQLISASVEAVRNLPQAVVPPGAEKLGASRLTLLLSYLKQDYLLRFNSS
jgi:hypothetical protein